ncbi:type IV pilus assembly protein PilP [Nitrosomonas eutropha]|uniref:pilus assembly protein PilP n=1 Tax=Nitrosomonas eutropha TaxID=916 RepID=UPI00089B85B2|nr:pilus assembly protein PilP [Nitrosomonas eutropha]SDX07455.1 type IV pilus assembly protein PilP [Nitrosomonas eutropha]
MNDQFRFWMTVMVVLFTAACTQEGYEDLESFVRESGTGLKGKVDPLPEIKPPKHFVYQAFEIPDPFSNRRNKQEKSDRDELQPDLKRPKEALENFPLENLAMVGSLRRGGYVFALVKAPDNSVHRVKTGNYLGQNFGLITRVSEEEVKLREITRGSADEWVERASVLMLQTQDQK